MVASDLEVGFYSRLLLFWFSGDSQEMSPHLFIKMRFLNLKKTSQPCIFFLLLVQFGCERMVSGLPLKKMSFDS